MSKTASARPDVTQGASRDDWVRHVVDIHFHPTHGTPFWIERAKELRIDAQSAIRSYEDLRLLGSFPQEALRTRNVLDFLPAAVANERSRLRVHETGGTTGAPARIAALDFFEPINRFIEWYLDELVGFPRGGNWLFIGPTGPHAIAESTQQMANSRGGMCYFIDLDPRFVKQMFQRQDMQSVKLYMEHIQRQAFAILDTQQIDVLGTTPMLLQMLGPELARRKYPFRGLMYGGTQLTKDAFHLLRNEFFPEAAHTAVYGNTLMGGAFLAPVQKHETTIAYYPIDPLVSLDVVDPNAPDATVAVGETGRVCMTVLSEERFLPRVLERDQAERWVAHPAFGCEGVANVRPLTMASDGSTEGVY